METISPTLTGLYNIADHFAGKPSHPRLLIASLSMLEASSFFFPELRNAVWKRTWDCMMSACREKNVQVTVAEAAIHNLIQLCPLMLDALSACAPDVRELLDNAAMSSEMREGTGGFLRMNKRRKERSTVSKYGRNEELSFIVAIWKYESLRAVFTDLIRVITLTENSNQVLCSPTSLENSVTQMVLGEISSVMPMLSLLPASSDPSFSEMHDYTQMMLDLCTTIAHTVDNSDIRAACFQILVSSLDSESPPLVVLPNIVDIALDDNEERQKEVNRILTGLLMNYDLKNVSFTNQIDS